MLIKSYVLANKSCGEKMQACHRNFVQVFCCFCFVLFLLLLFVWVYVSRLIKCIPLFCDVKENGLLPHITFCVNIRFFFGQCIIIYYNRSHYLKVYNYAKIITLIAFFLALSDTRYIISKIESWFVLENVLFIDLFVSYLFIYRFTVVIM